MRILKTIFFSSLIFLSWSSVVYAHTVAGSGLFVIHMTESGFEPSELEIKQGDTVIFENAGETEHWPASNIHPTHAIYPEFDPKVPVVPGDTWEFRFERAGSWRMHDHLFPEFTGEITVLEDPAYISSEKYNTQKKSILAKVTENIKIGFTKLSYRLFPALLDKKMKGLRYFDIAGNEEELAYWLRVIGSKKMMAGIIAESGGGSSFDCHTEAHEVGREAYKLFGADAYSDGDPSCHSGFYHGVMESFIGEKGTAHLSEDIQTLCDSFDSDFDSFECYHGVGHGIMAYQDYDLPAALKNCQQLANSFEQESCYGGVFMENVVTGQGNGAIEGHTTKWLSDDPHFPCNSIGDDASMRYQCYQMQTSWMLELFNYDFPRVARECLNASPDMISVCYRSFGRDSAGFNLRDPQKIIDSCALVPRENDYYKECLLGGTYVILDFWGAHLEDQADKLCALVDDDGLRADCESLVASRKADLGI